MLDLETVHETSQVSVQRTVTGPLDNNVYLVSSPGSSGALMIDAPGGDPDLLVKIADELDVETVLITHGHHDHVGAVERLRSTGRRVGMGAGDGFMAPEVDFSIVDDELLQFDFTSVRAVATPGHTPGSTCFVIDGAVFTGDTLFPGGPGATRWNYSDFDTIIESIEVKLFALSGGYVVLPGHGAQTTIAAEIPNIAVWKARRW